MDGSIKMRRTVHKQQERMKTANICLKRSTSGSCKYSISIKPEISYRMGNYLLFKYNVNKCSSLFV